MPQEDGISSRHNRDVVIEPLHALRPNLETLILTRVKRHIIKVEYGPPGSLGHALGILPDLTEVVRRDQDELQTIDLTNQCLQGKCLTHTALTFEQSERHMTPLNERGEECPKSSNILLLIDDLIALRFLNLDGLKFALRSGFKNCVLGKRVLVQLMHERYYLAQFGAPVGRDSQLPVQLSFGVSVSVAQGQDLLSLGVFEIGHLSHLADEIRRHAGIGADNPPRRNPSISWHPDGMLAEGAVQIDKQGEILPEDPFDISLEYPLE